jgi:ABC-type Fe3+-hydroxamate transport system substrate-binding protein
MKPFLIYFFSISLILSWWFLAFSGQLSPSSPPAVLITPSPCNQLKSPRVVDREKLKKALNGDINLMCALIAEWDVEAESLISKGIPSIQRLPRDDIKQVFALWQSHEEPVCGTYYPQTYLASGILMALVPEEKILALPSGFRLQYSLIPKERTDLIPFDADPFHLEAIGNTENITAFISPYSHPNAVLAMQQRSIPTVNLGAVQTPEDVKKAILQVGESVGAKKKSLILTQFIESAIMAMHNHLASLSNDPPPNVLYLNCRTFFSAPNLSTLTGNMLKQLNINQSLAIGDTGDWEIPLEIEDILKINPDCLILSTPHNEQTLQPPLSELKAFKNQRVFFVDKNIQETPSQHFLLGYFDLYDILAEARSG